MRAVRTLPIPSSHDAGPDDAALLRLGREHAALLDACRLAAGGPAPAGPDPLDTLAAALAAVEEQIAARPAHTAAGLLVRLHALWASLDHLDGGLFAPPGANAGLTHRLAWSLIEDAARLARS